MRERTTFIDRADFRGACFQIIKNWWIVLCWAIAVFLAATAVGNYSISTHVYGIFDTGDSCNGRRCLYFFVPDHADDRSIS